MLAVREVTLGSFLRSRRARLTVQAVGLVDGGRRRVPGLRRDELAGLAGVSVDYYIRLEQDRAPAVSDEILNALAGALRLSADERQYLLNFAHRITAVVDDEPAAADVAARLIDDMHRIPAMVLDGATNCVAINAAAGALLEIGSVSLKGSNVARVAFSGQSRIDLFPDIAFLRDEIVAWLRWQSGLRARDVCLMGLIAEMQQHPAFMERWASAKVHRRTTTPITVLHPEHGPLRFTNIWLDMPALSGHVLVAYTAADDATRRALDTL